MDCLPAVTSVGQIGHARLSKIFWQDVITRHLRIITGLTPIGPIKTKRPLTGLCKYTIIGVFTKLR